LKLLTVSRQDIVGGAARAAFRIHTALRGAGVQSHMRVVEKNSDLPEIDGPRSDLSKYTAILKTGICHRLAKRFLSSNDEIYSPAVFRSGLQKEIDHGDSDIVHLHWIGGETMSIAEIGRLRKPVVWTLHDMWAFCGAEHYTRGTDDTRFQQGYSKLNRPASDRLDINRWVWNRKRRHWKTPFTIVSPSHWLAECAKTSVLFKDWNIEVIHNCIDTDYWRPIDKSFSRRLLRLPVDRPLVLYGSMRGTSAYRKGADLFDGAVEALRREKTDLQFAVFGQSAADSQTDNSSHISYLGPLYDEISLMIAYSAADVFVVPSRQDNLPNTAVESFACGTPVVAFKTGGLPDIVDHMENGYLASPFDSIELAEGISWILNDHDRHSRLCSHARNKAATSFCYPRIAAQYKSLFENMISDL